MWKARLRSNYENFEEFKMYAETFNLHDRLGYATPEEAWADNPMVQGSTNPDEYRKVTSKPEKGPKYDRQHSGSHP